ncbi:MAG: zinc-ribbon domain-containing protein [Clostridia bacterium]|nr:zinc-ribbon domain-containing protein [Clostridia bacterium]
MFCPKCGKEVPENQKFCPQCGNNLASPGGALIEGLIKKIKLDSYVWFGIAALQVIIGLYNLYVGFTLNSFYLNGTTNIISGVIVLVIAAVNAINSKKGLDYCKEIPTSPVGIVAKYKPITGLIITLVYNLFLGGYIGVVGSIFGFLTRKYVLDHEAEFLALEQTEQPAEVSAQ